MVPGFQRRLSEPQQQGRHTLRPSSAVFLIIYLFIYLISYVLAAFGGAKIGIFLCELVVYRVCCDYGQTSMTSRWMLHGVAANFAPSPSEPLLSEYGHNG